MPHLHLQFVFGSHAVVARQLKIGIRRRLRFGGCGRGGPILCGFFGFPGLRAFTFRFLRVHVFRRAKYQTRRYYRDAQRLFKTAFHHNVLPVGHLKKKNERFATSSSKRDVQVVLPQYNLTA